MAISDKVDMRKEINELKALGEAYGETSRVATMVCRSFDDLYWPMMRATQRPAKTWAKPWWGP